MSDLDKIQLLLRRLEELEHRIVPDWQKPIVEVARQALESKLTELGRRLRRYDYLRSPSASRSQVG
jgi:hypothetical protein